MTPRDVSAGMGWDEAILDSINKSRTYLTEPDSGATPPITLIQNWNPDAGK